MVARMLAQGRMPATLPLGMEEHPYLFLLVGCAGGLSRGGSIFARRARDVSVRFVSVRFGLGGLQHLVPHVSLISGGARSALRVKEYITGGSATGRCVKEGAGQ